MVAGKALAQSYPVEADLVVGVPDSGLVAAMGYSKSPGFRTESRFTKTVTWDVHLLSRDKVSRVSSVKIKLNVIRRS